MKISSAKSQSGLRPCQTDLIFGRGIPHIFFKSIWYSTQWRSMDTQRNGESPTGEPVANALFFSKSRRPGGAPSIPRPFAGAPSIYHPFHQLRDTRQPLRSHARELFRWAQFRKVAGQAANPKFSILFPRVCDTPGNRFSTHYSLPHTKSLHYIILLQRYL